MLADDSAAIRKVIELTFADEGMEVVTVGDGRSAFEKVVQLDPDLVLADVYMPEVGGYELCRSIKQDERFAKTPVVLLISSFEPFDEAEARRAGADDVVTKPFQSIRQLVSRVGSLLQKGQNESAMTHQYSTLEFSETQPVVPAPFEQQSVEPQATVLVEAPVMEHVEPAEPAVTSATDVELQTADTMRLDRSVEEQVADTFEDLNIQDTIEVEPVSAAPAEEQYEATFAYQPEEPTYTLMSEPAVQTQYVPSLKVDDSVLDLEDEFLGEPQMAAGDVFLDLDFGDAVADEVRHEVPFEEPAEMAFDQTAVVSVEAEFDVTPQMVEEYSVVPETSPAQLAEPMVATAPVEVSGSDPANLSPAAIDAIARRIVEQMSEKVVREIAWEVVPELSELLIKQKLGEQR